MTASDEPTSVPPSRPDPEALRPGVWTRDALIARVTAAEPQVLFVEEHLLRRIVRDALAIKGVRTHVPHTHVFAARAERVRALLSADELTASGGAGLAQTGWAWLLPRPSEDEVREEPAAASLRTAWRRLFHGRLDAALHDLAEAGGLTRQVVLGAIAAIGQVAMDEARAVLHDEGLTGAAADDRTAIIELTALYQELRHFAPRLIPRWFPALEGRDDIARIFDGLVDAAPIFAATRPDGAAEVDPSGAGDGVPDDDDDARLAAESGSSEGALGRVRRQLNIATRMRKRANDAGAAIHAQFAARLAGSGAEDDKQAAERVAREALTELGIRLGKIEPAHAHGEWPALLAPLLAPASRGMVRIEARLLHDLQKACHVAEHETWDIDLGRWARRFGRDPIRRREVIASRVAVVRNLARALKRVAGCRLPEADRRRLKRAVADLAHAAEAHLRDDVGVLLEAGLTKAGLVPKNIPEQVAAQKLVAEILDLIVARGFVAFPDLRDLIARNQLKLADVAGLKEFLHGDALLQLNHELAETLDGAYQRAEIYRRGLQRVQATLFANPIGRALVRYLLLPIGGSFFLVQGLDHVVAPILGLFLPRDHLADAARAVCEVQAGALERHCPHAHLAFWSIPLFVTVAVVLLALIHSKHVRTSFAIGGRALGKAANFTFVEVPRTFVAWSPIAALTRHPAWRWLREKVFRPALWAFIVAQIPCLFLGQAHGLLWVGLPLFVIFMALLLSPAGDRIAETVQDRTSVGWFAFRTNALPALFGAIAAFFKRLVDWLEARLYTVDQWLRFREGDSRVGLGLKAVFGLFWGILSYLLRFMINLVAEPQLNPIKHFPVVTVSHKIFLSTTFELQRALEPSIGGVGAAFIAGLAQLVLPGLCGFLVWEFKENWRLYAANRARNLKPVMVGSHGETVIRLIRPGFHSGTVPKLFHKIRRAERRGHRQDLRRLAEEAHHIEEAVAHFVARELKALLAASGRFPAAASLAVEEVRLSPSRIRIELACPAVGPTPFELAFEEQGRFIVATVVHPGFVAALDASGENSPKAAFAAALRGLYHLAGVDLVREQIEAEFVSGAHPTWPVMPPYGIDRHGLILWPDAFRSEVRYGLRTRRPILAPTVVGPVPTPLPPAIARGAFAFKEREVPWAAWILAWNGAGPATIGGQDLLAKPGAEKRSPGA